MNGTTQTQCADGVKNEEVKLKPTPIKTIGYIVKENKTHIAVTSSVGCWKAKIDVLIIPKACILKRTNVGMSCNLKGKK